MPLHCVLCGKLYSIYTKLNMQGLYYFLCTLMCTVLCLFTSDENTDSVESNKTVS